MTGFIFNIDGGYLEGLCRGFKCGILKQSDYLNLVQCETLEGEFSSFSMQIFPVLSTLLHPRNAEQSPRKRFYAKTRIFNEILRVTC